MKNIILSTVAFALVGTAAPAIARDLPAGVSVDPAAFTETARSLRKRGITVSPAQTASIRQGVDKDNIYRLIGAPHFGEGITRRWNYVLFLHDGAEAPQRCRLRIDFAKSGDGYDVVVDRLTWSSDQCAVLASH